MTTFYKATFSDGHVIARSTVSGKYTFAWRVKGKRANSEYFPDGTWQESGWSSRPDLAHKAMSHVVYQRTSRRFYSGDMTIVSTEVAPAVEITDKEYRALKAIGAKRR